MAGLVDRLLTAAICGIALAADAGAAEAVDYRFGVFYDGSRIGEHRYEIVDDGDAVRVRSRAGFRVKALFVTVYRYRHHANALWQDDCLTALASVTDDNGRRHRVRAATPAAMPVLTRSAEADAVKDAEPATIRLEAECPATFAYWDLDRLRRPALINAQTGRALPATLTPEGREQRHGRAADRYRLEAESLSPITLWYARDDGQWLGLETPQGGGVLAYRLESVERRSASGVDEDTGVQDPPGI